jgi:hypothetical protein
MVTPWSPLAGRETQTWPSASSTTAWAETVITARTTRPVSERSQDCTVASKDAPSCWLITASRLPTGGTPTSSAPSMSVVTVKSPHG